jgi:F-type H+-transporting ATPase subunit c
VTTNKHPTLNSNSSMTGNIAQGMALISAAFSVGLIGFRAVEAVGRNPGASGKVLVQSILAMALAEGLGILALLFLK